MSPICSGPLSERKEIEVLEESLREQAAEIAALSKSCDKWMARTSDKVTENAALLAAIAALLDALRESVNQHCTCGGSGPDDPECCPACAVWHDMKAALREEVR